MLSALQAGNKGTQACITAATAVSGIIADLDTTIMFATAGTLNAENGETFADHRYWQRFQPGCPKLVVTSGHPAYNSEMWVIHFDINKILCGECEPLGQKKLLRQDRNNIPCHRLAFCISGSCPSDCPQTQQDQERQG